MDKFTTERKALHFAEVQEPLIIDENEVTRRVFLANINDAKQKENETVSGTLLHQRKKRNDKWEAVETINLATLKGGEGVKLTLDSRQLRTFFLGLQKLYELSGEGIHSGTTTFAVGLADEIIQVPKERKKFIEQLVSEDHGEEIWQQLIDKNPGLATRLSFARIQSERCAALEEFRSSLELNEAENYWQDFFSRNEWIFGYGLKYHFLTQMTDQPNYGGADFRNQGGQKGDYLMATNAQIKFTVLVEIKKSTTELLARKRNGEKKKYRNGAYLLGSELLGGVSQLQINCRTWQRRATDPENYDPLKSENIYTVNPKGILVIGNTNELETREEIETFEAFRASISNPEIVTFDELYERAKFIVENTSSDTEKNEDDEDLPF